MACSGTDCPLEAPAIAFGFGLNEDAVSFASHLLDTWLGSSTLANRHVNEDSCHSWVDVDMKHVTRARVNWVIAVSAAFVSFCCLPLSCAQCLAQESEAPDGFSEFDAEFSYEPDNFEEEFATDFGSSDFEDLPPAMQAVVLIVAFLFLLVMVGVAIFIIYLLYNLLNALPPQYRLMEPGMVWLLLIPCFNIIWNFFVYPQVARSYQNYFNAHGRTDVGDCGAGLGVAYAVCALLASIPCLNYVTGIFCGPAMIVLTIVYFVRLYGLKKEIQLGATAPAKGGQSPFSM